MAKLVTPESIEILNAARRLWQEDGSIEIDDNARISTSPGPEGTAHWVAAWVYVPSEETAKQEEGEDD